MAPVRLRFFYQTAHICFENKERKLRLLAEIAVYSWGLRRKDWNKLCQTQWALLLYGTSSSSSVEQLHHLFIHLFWFASLKGTPQLHDAIYCRPVTVPFPQVRSHHPGVYIPRYTSPTLFEQQGGFFYVTLQLIRKDDEDKANSLTLPPNVTNIWTERRSEITARLSQLS